MISQELKDARLQRDMQIIINGILSTMKSQPQAILLCGGYGRGEGAWFENKDGNVLPYNDYDLVVITETPFDYDSCNKLRKELASKIGIKWIDIDCYGHKQLSKFRPTIHNIDLYDGSTLIWGDKNWSKPYKKLNPKLIGEEDLLKLYRTRMWTLLGSWEGDFQDIKAEKARFFRNQMAKCILASCDMRLIAHKKYTSSYKERVAIIHKLFPSHSKLIELSSWAINEKLAPNDNELSTVEMKRLYVSAYNLFIESFEYAMKERAFYYLNPERTDTYIKFHTLYYAYEIYSILKCFRKRYVKAHELFVAQNYALHAFDEKRINTRYIKRASDLLQKWQYIEEPITNWNDLRIKVAEARNNI